MILHFQKFQSLFSDFIVIDQDVLSSVMIENLCTPIIGIGASGLIVSKEHGEQTNDKAKQSNNKQQHYRNEEKRDSGILFYDKFGNKIQDNGFAITIATIASANNQKFLCNNYFMVKKTNKYENKICVELDVSNIEESILCANYSVVSLRNNYHCISFSDIWTPNLSNDILVTKYIKQFSHTDMPLCLIKNEGHKLSMRFFDILQKEEVLPSPTLIAASVFSCRHRYTNYPIVVQTTRGEIVANFLEEGKIRLHFFVKKIFEGDVEIEE
ncbi:hypothetical protein FACS1894153_2970 [Bacteroidia bacterium]|nr:hypothetical protein FACS1894153_2970 [Bacteroidia bacterium]